jgi:hypothetical protein
VRGDLQDGMEGEGGSHLHGARAAHCVERVDTHEIRMLIAHTQVAAGADAPEY